MATTTDSGDTQYYYNQDAMMNHNLSTFRKSKLANELKQVQNESTDYDNVHNSNDIILRHSQQETSPRTVDNDLNNGDNFKPFLNPLNPLNHVEKKESNKTKYFSWGKSKKNSLRNSERAENNESKMSYLGNNKSLNDSDDETTLPLRRMSYWTCCVGYHSKKNEKKKSKKKDKNLPDGFTCNGNQGSHLPTSPLFQNNNIFQQYNEDEKKEEEDSQALPANTTDSILPSNGSEKQFPTEQPKPLSPATGDQTKVLVMLPFPQHKENRDNNSPKQTHTTTIFNLRKTSTSSSPPTSYPQGHTSLPTTSAMTALTQQLNNSFQNNNHNNSFQNNNNFNSSFQGTPTNAYTGISAPTAQKDYSLPPFGATDNHSQQGSFRRGDRESLMTPSFIPTPEMPSIPNQYKEIPASEPDLSKKPIRSALKGSKIHQQQNRNNSPSNANKNVPSFDIAQRPNSAGFMRVKTPGVPPKQTNSVGGVRFGSAEEHSSVPSSFFANKSNFGNLMNIKEENKDEDNDYDNVNREIYDEEDGDDDDDDAIKYSNQQRGLGAKVARNDSLARFLNTRAEKRHQTLPADCNVIPCRTPQERHEIRQKIGNHLNRRLSQRPTPQELYEKHILLKESPEQLQKEKDEIKKTLIRKLSFRPTVGELKERRIIKFNDYVEVTQVEEYDRRADKPWIRLTPRDKAAIRKELNEFKSQEMQVHENSRHYTRFHQP